MFEGSNRRQFQKGLDTEKARASRRNVQLSLRRKQREAHLQKKVRLLKNSNNEGEDGPAPLQSDIGKYIANIMQCDDISLQLEGVTALRKLLSVERTPPTHRVSKSGVIPKIIQFMFSRHQEASGNNNDIVNKLKFESAWVITNIAASTSECVLRVCQHGAIEGFVDLLRNATSPEIAEQAIWGLGNIAGDNKQSRNEVIKTGVMGDLVSYLPNSTTSMQANAIWTISNIFRYATELKVSDVSSVIPAISKVLREAKDEEIIKDCLWAFDYLTRVSDDDSMCQYLVENGIVNDCMKLLHQEVAKYQIALNQEKSRQRKQQQQMNKFGNPNDTQPAIYKNTMKEAMLKMNCKIYRPCLRFIGNLLSGNDDLTQNVLDAGYLDIIEPFAYHFQPQQRKEIIWSLSNILAGSHQQIESVLSRETILKSIIAAATSDKFTVQREACWCICNAVSEAITEQKKILAQNGAIEALCNMLNPQHPIQDSTIRIILEGLEAFLTVYGSGGYNPFADQIEECKGLDYMEDRQCDAHLTEETFHLMIEMIKRYWGHEENEFNIDDNTNNQNNNNQYVLADKLIANIDENTNQFQFGNNQNNNNNNNYGENNNIFQF